MDIRDTNLKDVGAFVHDTLSAIPKLKSHNKQRNVPNSKIYKGKNSSHCGQPDCMTIRTVISI